MGADQRASTLHLRDSDVGEAVAESFLGGRKGELVKLVIVIAFSAVASYFATVIRIAVLENDVRWIRDSISEIKRDIGRGALAAPAGGQKP